MTVLIGLLNLTLTAATAVLVLLVKERLNLGAGRLRDAVRLRGGRGSARVGSTSLFIAAGGSCVGAVLGGVIAAGFGITAPYWAGFVVAVIVSATTWRVFNRATVAQAYAEPAPTE